jgi:hypothetical protein
VLENDKGVTRMFARPEPGSARRPAVDPTALRNPRRTSSWSDFREFARIGNLAIVGPD